MPSINRRTNRHTLCRAILCAMVICLVWTSVAEACPFCKAALAQQDQAGGNVVAGYFWSILFMMAMPFVLLGSLAGYMYLLVRRARREAEFVSLGDAAAPADSNERPGGGVETTFSDCSAASTHEESLREPVEV